MVKQKWREELAASSSDVPSKRYKPLSSPCTSHLVQWLMEEIWWESMSWPKAQKCARAAILDGIQDEHLKEIASLGSFGFHEKNLSRDSKLLSILQDATAKSPEEYEFEVNSFNRRTQESYKVTSAASLLQDYLPCLEEHWPAHLETAWQASTEKLEKFWEGCDPKDPKFFEHPMLQVPDWKKIFVPYFTHADGAEFANQDKVMVTSSSPCLGRGTTKDLKLLNWAWPMSAEQKGAYEGDEEEGTLEEHWLVYCWDMQACFEGKRVKLDHRKRPFKGNQ